MPDGHVNHAHHVLDCDALRPRGLLVDFGARETREDERLAAVDEVRAVELRGHLHRERALAQRLCRVFGVGHGAHEVATHADEDLDLLVVHRLDRVDGAKAILAGTVDPEFRIRGRQKFLGGVVVDAARPVSLDVAVSADRGRAGAGPSDVSAQHEQVDDLTHLIHPVLVLAHTEAPADHDLFGVQIDLRGAANRVLVQSRLRGDLVPRRRSA